MKNIVLAITVILFGIAMAATLIVNTADKETDVADIELPSYVVPVDMVAFLAERGLKNVQAGGPTTTISAGASFVSSEMSGESASGVPIRISSVSSNGTDYDTRISYATTDGMIATSRGMFDFTKKTSSKVYFDKRLKLGITGAQLNSICNWKSY